MPRFVKILVIVTFFFPQLFVKAQTDRDSMEIIRLRKLYAKTVSKSHDSAIYYANKVLAIYERKGDSFGIAKVHRTLGSLYSNFHQTQEAYPHIAKALKLFSELKDSVYLVRTYYLAGINFEFEGKYDSAVPYLFKGKKIAEKLLNGKPKDQDAMHNLAFAYAGIENRLGSVYLEMNMFDKALGFHRHSLQISKQYGLKRMGAHTEYLLGRLYITYHHADSAYKYLKKAAVDLQKTGQKNSYASCLTGIGNYYWGNGLLDSALYYYQEALKIKKELGDHYQTGYILNNIGAICKDMKEFDKGLGYLHQADSFISMTKDYVIRRQNALIYSGLYRKMEDYKNALKYYKKYVSFKDSILNRQTEEKIAALQTQYETEKKENRIKEQSVKLDNQRKIIFLVFIIAISAIILILLFFNRYKMKQRAKENNLKMTKMQTEQKLLRVQMNPHFIFNSLNSVKGYVLQNNPQQAALYLDKFATLMRLTLEHSRESLIPMEDDIKSLELYLQLEKIRYENRFEYHLTVDEKIDTERTYIPPMLVQPFAENAVKHAFKELNKKGKLDITFALKKGLILCTVSDNGSGRTVPKENEKGGKYHKSLGASLTDERLSLAFGDNKIHVRFVDLKNSDGTPAGTKVEIEVPFETE